MRMSERQRHSCVIDFNPAASLPGLARPRLCRPLGSDLRPHELDRAPHDRYARRRTTPRDAGAMNISALRRWMEMRASRSPGPGGQNVNKVNTRVTLLFDFESCTALSENQKTRIREKLRARLSHDGRLRVVRHGERTQGRNRVAAEEGLVELLSRTLRREKPRTATRPTASSARRRLDAKHRRSRLKNQRATAGDD